MKWDLGLLAVVLLIAMLPSANVFRWSFRWLPFFHLILALCAAEALQTLRARMRKHARARLPSSFGALAFVLVAVVFVVMLAIDAGGPFDFPFAWWMLGLAALWTILDLTGSIAIRSWTPPAITFAALLATYLCIPPNCGVPKYNLSQQLTQAVPLDPQRLYLSVYPPPELAYPTWKTSRPVGQLLRLGSTSMWAGVRLINGYSPILTGGIAREFRFAIHGEIPEWMGEYLLAWQSGPNGELERLGVDGILVAKEFDFAPQPETEWRLATETDEGRVYHRRGPPLVAVRALLRVEPQLVGTNPEPSAMKHELSVNTREFAAATLTGIDDARNKIAVDVDVPNGQRPALLAFSRPFFAGYRASINGRSLAVTSYRGLMPAVEVPAGTKGRLILVYSPRWLIFGGAIALACATVCVIGLLLALTSARQKRTNAG